LKRKKRHWIFARNGKPFPRQREASLPAVISRGGKTTKIKVFPTGSRLSRHHVGGQLRTRPLLKIPQTTHNDSGGFKGAVLAPFTPRGASFYRSGDVFFPSPKLRLRQGREINFCVFSNGRNVIVLTLFLLISYVTEFRLVHNRKKNCHYNHIPFSLKENLNSSLWRWFFLITNYYEVTFVINLCST